MPIYSALTDLIGRTPLVELSRYSAQVGIKARILGKLELFNPTGSVKDRVAKSIIMDAECRGLLKEGSVIIEATSGNTGIGLASIAASRGYKVILTMPDTMSEERRKLLQAYGAQLVLTEGSKGMQGAIDKALLLAESMENSFIPDQFVNPANAMAHFETTGPEIWQDTQGEIDAFIAGVGTGGTLTGTAQYLRSCKPDIHIVAVEPTDSPVLSGGKASAHDIQGIGAGFIPKVLDTKIYDEVICVPSDVAVAICRLLVEKEGILAGISSGAAVAAACRLASRKEFSGATLVVLLPDTGERYLSTALFEDM